MDAANRKTPLTRYHAATSPGSRPTVADLTALARDLERAGWASVARDCLDRAGRLALRAA